MKTNEIAKELTKLMSQNPELEVVAMVDYEVVSGDDYSSWSGALESVRLDKTLDGNVVSADTTLIKLNEERIYFYSDDFEDIAELFGDEGVPDEKIDKMVDSMPWQDVIVLKVGTP